MTNTATLSEVQLRQFTGSENWYRHCINRAVRFTDGAKFLADQGGAYWLLDIIQSPSSMILACPAKSSRSGT
jgi:serine protease inhibitor ecotin